jgi:hypothetical protein
MSTQPDPDLDNLLSYVERESRVIPFQEVKENPILVFFLVNNLGLINLIR